jgi:CBS domain-containing protein
MTVASICQRTVDTVRPTETAYTAAQRLASRCVGSLVVVDDHGHAIGMLTDRDIALRIVAAGCDPQTIVGDIMSGEPTLVAETAPVDEAMARMRERGVRRLPVVDEDLRLVGIVSLEDVLARLAREMALVGGFVQRTAPARLATS